MGIRSERIAPTSLFCCNCLKKTAIQHKSTDLASQYPSMFDLFNKMKWDLRNQQSKKTAPTVRQYMKAFDIPEQTITELHEYACQEKTSETDFNLVYSQVMETKDCSTRDLSGFIEKRQSAALNRNEANDQAATITIT